MSNTYNPDFGIVARTVSPSHIQTGKLFDFQGNADLREIEERYGIDYFIARESNGRPNEVVTLDKKTFAVRGDQIQVAEDMLHSHSDIQLRDLKTGQVYDENSF